MLRIVRPPPIPLAAEPSVAHLRHSEPSQKENRNDETHDGRCDDGDDQSLFRVEVKGSRVTVEGKPSIIAAELKKGDDVLILRDTGGIPAWSGWRRR